MQRSIQLTQIADRSELSPPISLVMVRPVSKTPITALATGYQQPDLSVEDLQTLLLKLSLKRLR